MKSKQIVPTYLSYQKFINVNDKRFFYFILWLLTSFSYVQSMNAQWLQKVDNNVNLCFLKIFNNDYSRI